MLTAHYASRHRVRVLCARWRLTANEIRGHRCRHHARARYPRLLKRVSLISFVPRSLASVSSRDMLSFLPRSTIRTVILQRASETLEEESLRIPEFFFPDSRLPELLLSRNCSSICDIEASQLPTTSSRLSVCVCIRNVTFFRTVTRELRARIIEHEMRHGDRRTNESTSLREGLLQLPLLVKVSSASAWVHPISQC